MHFSQYGSVSVSLQFEHLYEIEVLVSHFEHFIPIEVALNAMNPLLELSAKTVVRKLQSHMFVHLVGLL